MSQWQHQRAKVAALTRSRPADDAELLAAKRDLRAALAEEHIRKLVDAAPPLTDEQRWKLSVLMYPEGIHLRMLDFSKLIDHALKLNEARGGPEGAQLFNTTISTTSKP